VSNTGTTIDCKFDSLSQIDWVTRIEVP